MPLSCMGILSGAFWFCMREKWAWEMQVKWWELKSHFHVIFLTWEWYLNVKVLVVYVETLCNMSMCFLLQKGEEKMKTCFHLLLTKCDFWHHGWLYKVWGLCLVNCGKDWALNDGSNFNFCQIDKNHVFIHLLGFLEVY